MEVLVRPENPADAEPLIKLAKFHVPAVIIFTGFADQHRNVPPIAEIQIALDLVAHRVGPEFVIGVNGIAVEWPAEHRKIRIPLAAAEQHHMVRVDAADGCDDIAIEWLQSWIEIIHVAVRRDRFVEKVVTEYGGLVAIMRGDFLPERDGELPIA